MWYGSFLPARRRQKKNEGTGMARRSLDDVLRDPPRLSPEERERLESMSEEEVIAAALSDPDAQPWTDEQLDEAVRRRRERLLAIGAGRRTRATRPAP